MNFKSRLQSGFTLVELLLYAGLFTILLVVFLQLFSSIIGVQLESESRSAISQDGQYILQRLSYDIMRADSVVSPTTLGATASAMTLTISGSSSAYIVSGGNLLLGSDQLNSFATQVNNFSVLRLSNSNGADSLQISITLTSLTMESSGAKTKTFQTTVSRRSQ